MRAVVQRVKKSSVSINNELHSSIGQGLLVFIGINNSDTPEDINWLINKITNLRIFSDAEGKMNQSLADIKGELQIVSQFTLFASTKKGNRPSFIQSAKPEVAKPLYKLVIAAAKNTIGTDKVQTGVFGADMQIELLNDGPVTITFDTENKE